MRAARGFTLIELIIAILVVGIIGTVAGAFFVEAVEVYVSATGQQDAIEQAGLAITRMAREVRAAWEQPDPDKTFGITTMTGDTLLLSVLGVGQVSYSRLSNVLQRNNQDIAYGLTNDGSNPLFSYYDGDGAIAATADKVWRVRIDLRLTVRGRPVSLQTDAYLRSRRS